MKILVIGNPISSGGKAGRLIDEMSEVLEGRGHEVEKFVTAAAGDAEKRVAKITDEFDRMVVVGGDGTLNEVVNGAPDACPVPLAQLPTGNANLLARELGLPWTPKAAIDYIEDGEVLMADQGVVNGRKFLMIVSVGFDAAVTEDIKRVRKAKLGNLGYVIPTIRTLTSHRTPTLGVVVDGVRQRPGAIVMVANVRNYGGFTEIAHRAKIDSGCFDIVILPSDKIISVTKYAVMGRLSNVSKIKGVQYLHGADVEISCEDSVAVQMDGDYFGRTPVKISLLPDRISLLAPRKR